MVARNRWIDCHPPRRQGIHAEGRLWQVVPGCWISACCAEMTKPYLPSTAGLAPRDSPARVECFSYHFHSIRAARQQFPTARVECIPPPHAERVCSDIPPPLAGGGWGRGNKKEWEGKQKRANDQKKALRSRTTPCPNPNIGARASVYPNPQPFQAAAVAIQHLKA